MFLKGGRNNINGLNTFKTNIKTDPFPLKKVYHFTQKNAAFIFKKMH